MRRKVQSFTIETEVLETLKTYANSQLLSMSYVVEKAIKEFISNKQSEKKPKIEVPEMTPERHAEDWEFRKKMVKEGKFPEYMAEEFPSST